MKENAGAVPPRVEVFGYQMVARVGFFGQIQRNHWPHLTNKPHTKTPPPDGTYKTAMQFSYLMLLVAYWSDPMSELMMAAGIHIPLWPLRHGLAHRKVNARTHLQLPQVLNG
jgi:hypothetical protein